MPSLNTGNAILSNPIKVETTAYNVGIGGAASSSFKLNVTGTTNLTGALTGTSGTFSGTSGAFIGVTINNTDATGSARLRVTSTGGNINDFSSFSASHASRANQAWIGGDGNSLTTVLQAGGVEFLRGASTGASTFSGSVTINSSSLLRLGNSDNVSTMQIWNSQSGAANNFLIYDNAVAAYRFVISNTGNVGIGTSGPSFILDVNDTNASGARGLRISTSSTAAGPALYLYINSGAQTNWAIGNSYAVGNTLEFMSSNSVGGNPGSAGTSRMLITPTGDVTINTARTSGANVNSITLSDNVTGVQTSGFGTRILATSNNGSAKSALAFEQDGGTNNDTSIAFYTQFSAASLDRRMTINRNGNVLIGSSTADYGFNFAVGINGGHSYLGNTMQISAGDYGGTERQGAVGVAEWANVSTATINLASIFPRINFTSRTLSVLVQIGNASTTTTMCSCLVLFGRTIGGTWSNTIIANININGLALSSASASGTTITLNFGTATFGSAMITILNRA